MGNNLKFGELREVLVSLGYGPGWSTKVYEGDSEEEHEINRREFLYHPGIIAYIKEHGEIEYSNPLVQALKEKGHIGGARKLAVVEAITPFQVREYDGSEWVETFDPSKWEG